MRNAYFGHSILITDSVLRRCSLEQKAAEENGGVGNLDETSKAAAGAFAMNGARASSTAPATSPIASRALDTSKDRVPSQSPKPTPPGKAIVPADDEEEDQLASDDDDTSSIAPSESGSTTNLSRRQTILEEKRLEKLRGARASSVASSIGGRKQGGAAAPMSLDSQIRLNAERDEHMEREFRRYLGVNRCRPFGRDRFLCEYWWFDGIGSMNLTGTGKGEVIYGTGRLFVQGPKEEDWAALASSRGLGEDGEAALRERRMLEEGADGPGALLGPHEWAFYEDDEEVGSRALLSISLSPLTLPHPFAARQPRQLAEQQGNSRAGAQERDRKVAPVYNRRREEAAPRAFVRCALLPIITLTFPFPGRRASRPAALRPRWTPLGSQGFERRGREYVPRVAQLARAVLASRSSSLIVSAVGTVPLPS